MMKLIFSREEQRALQGFWRQSLYQFPAKLMFFSVITACILIYCIITELLKSFNGKSPTEIIFSGYLSVGFIVIGAILLINALFAGDNRRLKFQLAFPSSRKICLIGTFITMLRDTVGLLMVTSMFAAFEILLVQLFKMMRPGLTVVNMMNLTDYGDGFWLSFSIIALFYALCYCLSIYLAKAKIKTSIVLGILLVIFANRFLYFGLDGLILKGVYHLVMAPAIAIFYCKIWFFTVLLYFLAYLPLRGMEV